VGERTKPFGVPAHLFLGADISPSTENLNYLCERKERISFIRLIENVNSDNLYSKLRCRILSKAFSIFKSTAGVNILLLKFKLRRSVSLIHWNVALWWTRKPNLFALNRPRSLMYLWTIFRITISNRLPFRDERLKVYKFWIYFEPLPCFGNVINFVYFEGIGKRNSRRQWLNICVRCTSGVLGRCLRHSFGIPSSP
jgi:hypothetical protein